MSSITRTSYELEYSEFTKHQTKTVHVKWYIFDFNKVNMVVAASRERKEYFKRIIETRVEDYAVDFSADSKFELKIESPSTDGEPIKISYAAPVSLCIKVICTGPNIHSVTEFAVVEENAWHRLPVEYVKNEIENHFDFKFIIDYGCYALKRISIPKSKLKKDLMNLMNNSIFSDVMIKSVDGTEFKAHKMILAVRSDVFKDYFENIAEDSTNIVESPFAADVLQQMLTYIYTDNAPEINKTSKELLKAADFYKISRLKKLCESALHKRLTVENAIDTLEFSHKHNATELKQITLEFLDVEKVKNVIETPSWQKLESVELIKSILERIVSNINP